jgi:hypothetical protein
VRTATITILLFLLVWTLAGFAIAWFIGEFVAAGRGWDSETKGSWAEKRRHDQEQAGKEQKAEDARTPDGTGEPKVTNTVR